MADPGSGEPREWRAGTNGWWLVLAGLRPHLLALSNFSHLQSALAILLNRLHVMNSIYVAADTKKARILVSLDISAAFDTIDPVSTSAILYVSLVLIIQPPSDYACICQTCSSTSNSASTSVP